MILILLFLEFLVVLKDNINVLVFWCGIRVVELLRLWFGIKDIDLNGVMWIFEVFRVDIGC